VGRACRLGTRGRVLAHGSQGEHSPHPRHHIRRMQSGWLFDASINADMWLLQQREDALCAVDRTRRPSFFFSSYFFFSFFYFFFINNKNFNRINIFIYPFNFFISSKLSMPT
jgi:hypothetical protein